MTFQGDSPANDMKYIPLSFCEEYTKQNIRFLTSRRLNGRRGGSGDVWAS